MNLDGTPIYTRVQRLTTSQWEHAVADVLRFAAPANLSQGFAAPAAGDSDFTNNEKLLFVDNRAFTDFETGAEAAAALATETPDALTALYPGTDAEGFVRTLGRRAFRRPLTPDEETRYGAVFTLGETLYGAGFAHGAALVVRAMLQSPKFLYRSELGPAGDPLSGYEIASKLSFWLLGTTPTDALLDAAEAGELDTADGLAQAASAMLEQQAAVEVMRDFHGQLYHLARFRAVAKPGVPEYDVAVNAELEEASYRFFDWVFQADGGLREILTSDQAFVGPGLASLYGIEPAPAALEERALGASRTGYFMQVPFLLSFGEDRTPDPIGRGAAIDAEVLCNRTPPFDGEMPAAPPPSAGQTNRERIEQHTSSCGSCHNVFIDPIGFSFERFDGMGKERDVDEGKPVDTTGSYPFEDGTQEFGDAKDLMLIMANGRQAHTCYAKKVAGYALQRDIVSNDRPLLDGLASVSRERSLKELMLALVQDPAFRLRAEGTP